MQIRTTTTQAATCGLFTLGCLCLTWAASTATAQPNTGMADSSALINAYDRFVAGGGGSV